MKLTANGCILIGMMAFSLAACSDKNDTSVSLSASEAASASSTSSPTNSAPVSQTLTSTDGNVSIVVNQGQFTDQSSDAANWVTKDESTNLTLLQRDDSNNITLSVNSLGAPKLKADDYFKKLSSSLKANGDLNNVKVGMATDNRMNYRFSHSSNERSLNENCVALYGANNLYVVCASSDSASDEQLSNTLKNISVKN